MDLVTTGSRAVGLLPWVGRRIRARHVLYPMRGDYNVHVKDGRKKDETVKIAVKGDLLHVDMDLSGENRGHAKAKIPMDVRTLEGVSKYDHFLPDGELLFGSWHLKIADRSTISVTNRYIENETGRDHPIDYIWRRKGDPPRGWRRWL